MWLTCSLEFMNKISASEGNLNDGNVILCCINARPTTGHSHRECVPLISDSSSAMSSNSMWRHTASRESPLSPHRPSSKIDAENLLSRHSSKPK